ncbi:hypothetical protein F5J12DRAFT_819203 [Pisolithus orientalis]|uniref:uncharacterized protein n=1 Tax=Pisolithus orientalis TaxID=936130 RepID=UPI0022251CCC|nr:uncharacterized protein F5J12DRAFT_819203 [Pisolithus orientalis]KAI6012617.1 hypothetical protein F5J12DRAFT_819203 [Pisolithus orientalis]
MSFIRATSRVARPVTAATRLYSAEAGAKNSNLPLYLVGAGLAVAGAYGYMTFGKTESEKPKKILTSPLDPQKFVDIKLKRVEPYSHNTSVFVFDLPEGQASLLPIASCVFLKAEDLKDANGKPMARPYTPISPSDLEGELSFLIKKYETGNVSKYIHSLSPGDTLAVKGPLPKWPWKMNEFDEVGLIAGGTGIAPMYQVLQHVLADKNNKTKFKLLFANVSEADILLREELDAMKKKYPKTFDVVYVVDKPSEKWKGPSGYINVDLIKQHIAPASLGEKMKVFVCGPPPQVAAIAGKKAGREQGELGGILKELGYTEDQVFKF